MEKNMAGIKTNMQHIQEMDIDLLSVFLSDFNTQNYEPLEIKRWLERPFVGDRIRFDEAADGFIGDFEGVANTYQDAYEMEISFLENNA
jgi:hypothetical protein